MQSWKKILLTSAGVGIGLGIGLAATLASLWWYHDSPKPWNSKAIVSLGTGFANSKDNDNQVLYLSFDVENTTNRDYEVNDSNTIKIMWTNSDGSHSEPLDCLSVCLDAPVFIPAHQKGTMGVSLRGWQVPILHENENPARFFGELQDLAANILGHSSLSIFDSATKYQIELVRKFPEKQQKR